MGDRYVTTYLTIISLATALLVGFGQLGTSFDALVSVEAPLFVVVLLVGTITFARLVERRARGIEYLRAINRVHCYFTNRDSNLRKYLYWPANDDCPPMQIKGTALGGLRDMVAGLNSLVFGLAAGTVAKIIWPMLSSLVLALIGAVIAVVAWLIHHRISKTNLNRAEQNLNQHVLFPQSKQ